MTTASTTQASTAYQQKKQTAELLLEELHRKLQLHEDAASERPRDWGFVGDLSHLVEVLQDANTFFVR